MCVCVCVCVCLCVCVMKTDSALGLCVCVMKTFCFWDFVYVCVYDENGIKIFKTMESRKWGGHTLGLLMSLSPAPTL